MPSHGFNLTANMKRKFATNHGGPITIRFKNNNLIGPDLLNVTKTQNNRIHKAIQNGKGLQLTFSSNTMKTNLHGGFVDSFRNNNVSNLFPDVDSTNNRGSKAAKRRKNIVNPSSGQHSLSAIDDELYGNGCMCGNGTRRIGDGTRRIGDGNRGGFLEFLQPAIDTATTITKTLGDVMAGARGEDYKKGASNIERRLAYLRGNGTMGGSVKNSDTGLVAGIQLAKKIDNAGIKLTKANIPKIKAMAMQLPISGNGIQGAGFWNDFLDGFTWGLQNPIKNIELLGRELVNAISGKGARTMTKKNNISGSGIVFL